jgi:hypothetical protein
VSIASPVLSPDSQLRTYGDRNIAAAPYRNARDATPVLPTRHYKPVKPTLRHFAEALPDQPGHDLRLEYLASDAGRERVSMTGVCCYRPDGSDVRLALRRRFAPLGLV